MHTQNLFDDLPRESTEEVFTDLLEGDGFRLVRIVSQGQATPPDQWYDQTDYEWVIVLRGSAELLFDGDDAPQTLGPGDFVHIPAHQRHRVTWTDPNQPTIWLALHHAPSADD